MSDVLDYVREKDPRFKDVPDDDLTLYIGSKKPEFLKDSSFKDDFQKAAAQKSLNIALKGTGDVLKILTSPAAGEASSMARHERLSADMESLAEDTATQQEKVKALGVGESVAGFVAQMSPLNVLKRTLEVPTQIEQAAGLLPANAPSPTAPAISPETARKMVDYLDPNSYDEPGSMREGVKAFLADTLSGLTSPDQAAAIVAVVKQPELVGRLFQVETAAQVPQAAQNLSDAIESGDKTAIGRASAALATTAAIPAAIEKGLRGAAAPKPTGILPTEEIKTVAPQTAAALEQTGKGTSAIHGKTTEVLQPVQPQPVSGKGEVPTERPSTETGPRGEPAVPKEAQAISDYERYLQVQAEMKRAFRAGDQEALAKAFAENEQIKNRHQGMPPKPPEAPPTVTETTPKAEPAAAPTAANARPAIRLVGGEVVTGEAGQTHPDIIAANGLKAEEIDQRGFVDDQGNFLDREQAAAATGLPTTKEDERLHSTDLPEAQPAPTDIGEGQPQAVTQPAPSEVTTKAPVAAGAEPATAEPSVTTPVTQEPATMTGAAHISEIPETGVGGEKYGVAERVRQERAKAGQVEPVAPGEGVNTLETIEFGREVIRNDPTAAERLMSQFETDPARRLSAESMAVARAHGEMLAESARRIEETSGTDSPEYRAARDELSAWDKRSKAMQTEWHKAGMAQQGETDIDTGSFTGLQRAYTQDTGKTFNETQATNAKRIAKGVKDAEDASGKSEQALRDEIQKEFPQGPRATDAEKAALDAASKTVRENAVRLAEADKKARLAKTEQERQLAKIEQARERKKLEEAQRVAREAAVRLAKAEREAPKPPRIELQSKAERKALGAASKAVRDNAERLAKAENKERVAATERDKAAAKVQSNAARKALEAAQERARKAAADLAKKERELLASPERKVWDQARIYLEKGEGNFDDIRNKIATDLGMSVRKVTDMLAYTKKMKGLADDLWRKRQQERSLKLQAKRWIHDQSVPFFQRTFQKLPRFLFGLKVFGHGTVALGTHSPALAFQPQFWPEYARNFGRMYGMVFKPAYHERLMQELVRRDNYTIAQRAGLQNNPFQFEEYVDPSMNVLVRKLTGGGSRGYSVLKLLRQDVFDHQWNNLPKTQQIPEVAQALAESINHVTGVTQRGAPRGTHILLFAPRLEASRVAWMAVDPAKSMLTLMNWKNASYGDRVFAINQIKEKLTVAGTMAGLLGLNQAILSYSDSKQKVNFTNPLESDFLKFKAGGMNISYGNPMISMARLPLRLLEIGAGGGGKTRNVVYPDERAGTALFDYLRSQESPFASLVTDLILRSDPTGRPLPHATYPVPARLRRKGVEPYTWPEFLTEQLSPIPLQEAIKEVWGEQFGMSDQQQKALATMLFMWGTGGRMSEDLSIQ